MIRNDLTALATFDDDIKANLARNSLEAAKIKAYLSGESSNTLWHIGNGFSGVQLWVANEDLERARDVLNQPSESGRALPAWAGAKRAISVRSTRALLYSEAGGLFAP